MPTEPQNSIFVGNMSKQTLKKEKRGHSALTDSFWTKHKVRLIVFFSAIALYFNSVPNNYNLDDEIVTRNHRLTSKGIAAIPEIFTEPYYKDASGYAYEYRPIVLVSFAIEHSLFGENVHVSHFINVLLYSLLCLLLFVCLQTLLRDYGSLLPFIATIFFVVHPAHTEVVDSIKNRDEILALGGSLAALFFALRWVDTSRWYFVPVSVLCFLVSLLSKQSTITWVVVIPVALIFFRHPPFLYLVALTLLFLVPVAVYVPIPTVNVRIGLLLSCLLFVILCYGFMYWLTNVKQYIRNALSFLRLSFLTLPKINLSEQTTEFKDDGSSFTRTVLAGAVAFTLFVYGVSTYCILHGNIYLLVPVVSIYLFFAFTAKDSIKKILFIPSFVLTMIVVYSIGVSPDFYTSVYLMAATVYFMYYKGQFRYVAVPVALVCVLIDLVQQREYIVPFLEVLPIVMLSKKRLHFIVRIVASVTMVVGLLFPLANLFREQYNYDDSVRYLMVGLLLVVTFRPAAIKLYSYLTPATIVFNLFFLLAITNMSSPPYYIPVGRPSINMLKHNSFWLGTTLGKVSDGAESISKVSEIDLTDKGTQRPVSFIEAPVKHDSPMSLRIGTAFVSLSHYLYKIILPYPMSFYYGYRFIEPTDIVDPVALVSMAIYVLLFLLAVVLINKRRLISFALLLFLISISAYSNFFYPLPGSIADRFMFTPSVGWCLLLAYLILYFTRTDLKTAAEKFTQLSKPAGLTIGVILLTYSTITFARNLQWKDHVTLFRHDIDYVNESAQAHNLLAVQLILYSNQLPQGPEQFRMREEAIPHFKKSIEIYPDFFNPVYDAARVYTMINQPDSALVYYKKAAAMNPDYYESHLSAAEILARAGRWNEAIPFLEHITQNYPTEGRSYDLLSLIYYQMKNYETSIAVNRKAMQYIPNSFNPPINIGRVFEAALNQPDSALYYYRIALSLNPSDAQLQQTVQQLSARSPDNR